MNNRARIESVYFQIQSLSALWKEKKKSNQLLIYMQSFTIKTRSNVYHGGPKYAAIMIIPTFFDHQESIYRLSNQLRHHTCLGKEIFFLAH